MKRIFCADRVLSLVMAILMTIALLPTGASAAEAKTWAVTGPDAIPGITPVIKTWAATGADAILDIAPAAIKVTESPLSRVAWNFRLHGWSGVGLDGTQLGQEGYYGAEILCSGSQVTYRAYTHQSGVKPVSAVAVETSTGKTIEVAIGLDNKQFGVRNLADGAYALDVTFSTGHTSRNWFYVLSGNAYAVDVDAGSLSSRQSGSTNRSSKYKYTIYDNPADVDKLLQDWIAAQGVTPENSLGLENITYQYWDDGVKGRNDTGRWAALAHEIVPDEYASLSDGVKALMLHDWITANLSYDNYLTTVLQQEAQKDLSNGNGQSRNFYYKDNSGKYSVWNTRTGICIDFSNIFTIMCRELGIPCNVMAHDLHAWNIVWLDGRWKVVDLTSDIQRKVYGADTNEITNAELIVCYKGFCQPAKIKFGTQYSVGTHRYSLDEASVKKYHININTYGLYTKESIQKYLGVTYAEREANMR